MNSLVFSPAHVAASADSRAWPFEEARRLIKRLERLPGGAEKTVIFETGYGPSGLPHIGTFGEVARTTMVRHAFELLTEGKRKTRLICFSDDMDGLRKVPTNVPNQAMLQQHLDKPLTRVPDPFGKFESFAHHNNAMLRDFLDRFGFEYEFYSATECYTAGMFDATLLKMLAAYDKVMDIILPTLGPERQATYSPFLPVSERTGRVLQVPMVARDVKAGGAGRRPGAEKTGGRKRASARSTFIAISAWQQAPTPAAMCASPHRASRRKSRGPRPYAEDMNRQELSFALGLLGQLPLPEDDPLRKKLQEILLEQLRASFRTEPRYGDD